MSLSAAKSKNLNECDYLKDFELICENQTPDSEEVHRQLLEEVFPCDCTFREDTEDPELQACGARSDCINRILLIECEADECNCREHCQNQRFQKRQYANVEVFKTPDKGFGLRTTQDLRPFGSTS